jgi:hypothetical protein
MNAKIPIQESTAFYSSVTVLRENNGFFIKVLNNSNIVGIAKWVPISAFPTAPGSSWILKLTGSWGQADTTGTTSLQFNNYSNGILFFTYKGKSYTANLSWKKDNTIELTDIKPTVTNAFSTNKALVIAGVLGSAWYLMR